MRSRALRALIPGVCAGVGAVLSACSTPSINPIYSEEQTEVIKDDRIVGLWVPDDPKRDGDRYRVGAAAGNGAGGEPPKWYTLAIEDDKGQKKNAGFELRLVRLGASEFIDLFPDNAETKSLGDRYGLAALPMHIIMPVVIKEDHITARPLDTERVYKLLTEAPHTTPHTVRDKDFVILTGSTEQVQEFFRKISGDDQVFDKPLELSRATVEGAGAKDGTVAVPEKPKPEKKPQRSGRSR